MGGALLQLAAYGSENIYLNGNPEITYFKTIYKRYTNFAIQNIDVLLEGPRQLSFDKTTRYKIKIPRNGDLINDMYLKFNLPDIFSDKRKFKWIDSIGYTIIDYLDIFIGGSRIQRLTGKYLDTISKISLNNEKKQYLNNLINSSNINENYIYNNNQPEFSNNIINKYSKTSPSIQGKTIFVPLHLWFSKNWGSSIPLIALQYHDTELNYN